MFDKITLQGNHVRLEPLSFEHQSGLCDAIKDGSLNELFFTLMPHPDKVGAFIQSALNMFDQGKGLAFVNKPVFS